MTTKEAEAWKKVNWASENFDRDKYLEALSFLEGREAGVREAAQKVSNHLPKPFTMAGIIERETAIQNILNLLKEKQ
jgi:hypothetical protein